MTNDNARNVDRAWELMKKIGFAMLVTHDGTRTRPEIGDSRKVAM